MEYVGAGTNYNALPWNGGVPIPANQRVEINNGRVYGATINEVGDFEIGGNTFSIDGTTGEATINTSQFNVSGLNFIGPFSRNGGFSTVGVQLKEISNNTSLIASTGGVDGNTVPTQNAVKGYLDNNYDQIDKSGIVNNSVVYYDAAAAKFKANSTWTISSIVNGGDF